MNTKNSKQPAFKAGMYLLETLTSGMYNEPLSVYREYIQNAVDSIDLFENKRKKSIIKIDIDPFKKRIRIFDNGMGVSAKIAQQILSSIGSSEKRGSSLRGFRGIGRLGGLAFCDNAIYRTKAEGENVESVQKWDCKKLRQILSNSQRSIITLSDLFKTVTHFEQSNNRQGAGSYFEVVLEGVSSFRNYIFDIRKIKNYLSQVAPLPFNSNSFSFTHYIDKYLEEKLIHYGKYNILLNGELILKPYADKIKITKSGFDYIDNVKLLEIKVNDNPIAYGWIGERRELIGAIIKGDESSGIRIRVGNILLGDSHLLDACFREPRFNSYIVGEIHVNHPMLIPNSRRDDFVDNDMKTLFYNAIEREIGLPISKEIRYRSRIASENKIKILKRKNEIKHGDISNHITKTGQVNKKLSNLVLKQNTVSKILSNCMSCDKLKHILKK